jgi:hypothetical protein
VSIVLIEALVLLLPCSPVAEVEPRSASADLIRHIVF